MRPAVDKTNVEENSSSNPKQIESSIPEQIIQQMLEGLQGKTEFPAHLMDQIVQLGKRGQLHKPAEIMKVITATTGGPHAAA